MNYIKLSKWANTNGLTYQTAFKHFKAGLIKNTKQLDTGTILVGVSEPPTNIIKSKRVIIYSRVSSNEMKDNLIRQQTRLEEYAISKGYTIVKSIKEISSGMNDSRPKLLEILKTNDYDIILVEHKDRLTRFGFNYIETLLNKDNKEIEVVYNTKLNENLIDDLISIIYSFSARIYGSRKGKHKANKIKDELNDIS